jgi:hypothetical protein
VSITNLISSENGGEFPTICEVTLAASVSAAAAAAAGDDDDDGGGRNRSQENSEREGRRDLKG